MQIITTAYIKGGCIIATALQTVEKLGLTQEGIFKIKDVGTGILGCPYKTILKTARKH